MPESIGWVGRRRPLPVFFVVLLCALMAEWTAALLGLSLAGAWLWVVLNFVFGAFGGGVAVWLTDRRWCVWHARTGLVLALTRWATLVWMPDLFGHGVDSVVALLAPSVLAYLVFTFDGRRQRRARPIRTGFAPDSSSRA